MGISSISPLKSYGPRQFSVTQCKMKCSTGVDLLTGRAEHNSRHCIAIMHSTTRCKNYQRDLSAGCKHLPVISLLGFLPGKGPLWRIFLLHSINTTSIWIFPYNLFQREYGGCKRVKRDWEFCFTQKQGVFFPPSTLVNWKTPSAGGNVWYETVVKTSLQHFSSLALCPLGRIIPAQRGAGFFALLFYINHFLKDFFHHRVHNTLQKNRGEIQVYHEIQPEDESLFSSAGRSLTSLNSRHSFSHRQCIVHSQGMNSVVRESVSISYCDRQCFKGSI